MQKHGYDRVLDTRFDHIVSGVDSLAHLVKEVIGNKLSDTTDLKNSPGITAPVDWF